MIKVISDNKRLKKFINWKPRYNTLGKIVKTCLNWEKNLK